ncbi:TnsD family transposase [Scytonema sp. PCC 10023]|uniref:TnsD family transposase n=1 Tax=Scytonema sp. PCC 10023 TaxID=1680591 RepID=UPI0039C69D72
MVSFLPKPYPDEILYSILARYHIRSGNTSPKNTLQELFNCQTIVATVDLPSNLNSLIQNINFISNYQVEDLIYNHTLYPFYSIFLPPKRAIQVMESMKAENGGDIHTRVGIMASSMTLPRYFRFCPNCLEEDLTNYGEPYWHRLHQTPGVLVCPTHGVLLQDSIVPLQGFNKHEYYAASTDNCIVSPNPKNYSNDTLEKLRILAKDIYCLLKSHFDSKEPDWFCRQYRNLLIDNGLANANGRVKQNNLLDSFLFFYGREMLTVVNSMVDYDDEHNWLVSIVRKHRKSFHPIRHLLIIRFLANSIEEFFNTNYEYKPFGNGPWICLNAAAQHYLKPVITNLIISHCLENKKPLGTFTCCCGMVYCRTGPDKTEEDKLQIGKIITFGSVWEQKLKNLVEVERLGLRETARRLNVDARTVKRYVSKLKLKTYWRTIKDKNPADTQEVAEVKRNSVNDLKVKYRQDWVALQTQYPEASKTNLRKLAPAIYAWLYRNDPDWLHQNSPQLQTPVPNVAKVDWQERDRQILAQVQDGVRSLLNADKPQRISISRIGKTVGLLALLEKHLEQMPLTKAYLESVTESVEDFQIRRIKWAIKLLDDSPEEIQRWKVIRVAGLGENLSERVKAILECEL